jgi:ACS family hexuronate transporter-like MFS transporter
VFKLLAGIKSKSGFGSYRWKICALLFFATSINYIDRQVLGILAPGLQKIYGWSESDYGLIVTSFQVAYAIGFLFMGHLMDKIGSRVGYMISIFFWSMSAAAHAFFKTPLGIGICRFGLGIGEAGNFPAATKVAAEWFPPQERPFVTGIFISGSSIGAMIAPLVVPFIAIHFGWRWSFIFTALLGLIWLVFWYRMYRVPREHPGLSAEELNYIEANQPPAMEKVPWKKLFRFNETWAFAIGKFLTDPVFSFFFFFLPKFFYSRFGVQLDKIGVTLLIIYLMSDVGSIAGGWLSSTLLKKGWSVNASRKITMLVTALAVLPVYFASQTHQLWVAVALIGLALAAHQAWSANILTLPSDIFSQKEVGSVVGIGSTFGAIGGTFGATAAGFLLQATGSYVPLFVTAGFVYLLALAVLQILVPRIQFRSS